MTLKEKILLASDYGKDIIVGLYPESLECFNTNKKFRMRDEKTASTSLKLVDSKAGIKYWAVNDWGDSSPKGLNAIDLYAQYHNVTFAHACQLLASEYNIDTTLKKEVNRPTIEQRVRRTNETPGIFSYMSKDFTDEEIYIFGPFVTQKVLDQYGWMSLRSYCIIKEDKVTEIFSNDNYPIFARDCGDFYKIYKPYEFEKQYRFIYMPKYKDDTIRTKDFINGLTEISRLNKKLEIGDKLPAIFICSGERDAMNVAGMGYYPVWFNSETTNITYEQYEQLKFMAEVIYNIPDIDETGIRQGERLALQYLEIRTIDLPDWLRNRKDNSGRPRKDLRDFLELLPRNESRRQFEMLITTAPSACFWETLKIGKRVVYNIKAISLLYFLRLSGFHRWQDPFSLRWSYVHIVGSKVTKKDANEVRDFVRSEIQRRRLPNEVLEAFISSSKSNKGVLDNLDSIKLDFTDVGEHKVLHFENGSYCVDKSTFTKLTKPQTYYWGSKIIPHKITRIPPCYEYDNETKTVIFKNHPSKVYRFLMNASRIYWRTEFEERATGDRINDGVYREKFKLSLYGSRLTSEQQMEQVAHLLNKMYVYGYLVYGKKTDSHAFAVWAMENRDIEVSYCSGGSGKTLFYRCLQKLGFLKMVTLDGRNPMLFNNNHYMDRVDYDTDIIHFEDTGGDFKFQVVYAIIDGGVTVNRKNEGSYTIPYQDAPNIVMCSNYAPPDNSPSTRRRLIPVIFSDYYHYSVDNAYNETRQVKDDFGGDLFGKKYTEEDYNADCNFLVDCLQLFMTMKAEGQVCQPPLVNFEKRMHRQLLGDMMLEFFDYYFIEQDNSDRIILKYDVYAALGKFTNSKVTLPTIVRFKKALIEYCRYKNFIYNPEELCVPNDTRILRTRKDGDRKITLEYICVHIPGNKIITDVP